MQQPPPTRCPRGISKSYNLIPLCSRESYAPRARVYLARGIDTPSSGARCTEEIYSSQQESHRERASKCIHLCTRSSVPDLYRKRGG